MKIKQLVISALLSPIVASGLFAAPGPQNGEAGRIQADVIYSLQSGQTTTSNTGTLFNWGFGSAFVPNLIYVNRYQGTFPLYFVGNPVGINVRVANITTQGNKPFKVRVEIVNNVLNPDGSLGMQLGPTRTTDLQLSPGQSQNTNDTFTIPYDPNIPSGLDLTTVSVYHLNDGTPGAGLIRQDFGVWCPPNFKP